MAFGFKKRLERRRLEPRRELKIPEEVKHKTSLVSMADVIRENTLARQRFFDEPGHRLESGLLRGQYFITSRVAGPQGGKVYRVAQSFQRWPCADMAIEWHGYALSFR